MHFFRVELFGKGSIVGHIRKNYGHQFALALDGAAGGEDLVGKKFGCIGLRRCVINGRDLFWLS